MRNPEGVQSTFWRICNDQGNCHCDWRLSLGDCEEDKAMRIIYIINAVGSATVSVIGMILLFYRIYYRQQRIFTTRASTGFIRPKPIEAMLFMAIIFNILRMVQAIIIITDTAPNVVFRSFMYEIPWQFGLGAFACYVFGIAHAVADSSKAIFAAWFNSSARIDIVGTTFIILPFITNNICSIAEGVYAQRGEDAIAAQFMRAQSYLWTIYCGSLGCMITLAGIKLLRLLRHHLTVQNALRSNIGKIMAGMLKVKVIMVVGCTCLYVFAFILCLYGVLRDSIIRNTTYNLAIAAVWTYDGVLATILVELALIINPRMTASLGVSSEGTTDSRFDQINGDDPKAAANSVQNTASVDSVTWEHSKFSTASIDHSQAEELDLSSSVHGRVFDSGDISMEMVKDNHNYKSREMDGSSLPNALQIERDKMNYNATTIQKRTPPRHNMMTPTTENILRNSALTSTNSP